MNYGSYEKLTIKEKAIYNRKKWFILLAATATFGLLIFFSELRFETSGRVGWMPGDYGWDD